MGIAISRLDKKLSPKINTDIEKFFSSGIFLNPEIKKLHDSMLECRKSLKPNEFSIVFEILTYKLIKLKPELFLNVQKHLSLIKNQYQIGFDLLDKLIKLPTSEILELGFNKEESDKLIELFFDSGKPYYKTCLIF